MEIDNELGFQYLDTTFSGTKTNYLSGKNDSILAEFFLPSDLGVASSLENIELKSYFNKNN
jgi:hypothetical protein